MFNLRSPVSANFRGKPHEQRKHRRHGRRSGARGHAGLRVLCPYGRLLQVHQVPGDVMTYQVLRLGCDVIVHVHNLKFGTVLHSQKARVHGIILVCCKSHNVFLFVRTCKYGF